MTSIPVYQWQPTTSRVAERAGIDPSQVIRFDQNSSPAAPPWVAEVAARAAKTVNEYPEADYRRLREAIADYHDVAPAMVVPGAGADEMIALCAQAFLRPGDRAVADSPTYPMYRIATVQRGASYEQVVRRPDCSFPGEELAAAAEGTRLTWLCLPSNPVGDRPARSEVDRIRAAAGGMTVIDAAYAEFTGDRWAEIVETDDRVVVLGTLSKAFGLAGIRVGYAVAASDAAAALEAVRPPGSISTVSAALAERALADTAWMRANVRRTLADRADLDAKLRALGLRPRPSSTNFLLVPIGARSFEVADALLTGGIVARSFSNGHPLDDHLRFTVRTPPEHDRLAEALEEVLS